MNVTINNRFAVLLAEKQVKERRNIPLAEVAESTGISRRALYAWENNDVHRFDDVIINALCRYFAINPGELFEYIPDDNSPKAKQKTAHK